MPHHKDLRTALPYLKDNFYTAAPGRPQGPKECFEALNPIPVKASFNSRQTVPSQTPQALTRQGSAFTASVLPHQVHSTTKRTCWKCRDSPAPSALLEGMRAPGEGLLLSLPSARLWTAAHPALQFLQASAAPPSLHYRPVSPALSGAKSPSAWPNDQRTLQSSLLRELKGVRKCRPVSHTGIWLYFCLPSLRRQAYRPRTINQQGQSRVKQCHGMLGP